MSKVNLDSSKNNVERLVSIVEELQQLVTSKKEEINVKIRELNDNIAEFSRLEEKKIQAASQEEEKKANKTTELEKLEQNLQELTHTRDVLHSEKTSKQKDIQQLSSIILEKEKVFTELSVEVDSLERRIAEYSRKIEEIDVLSEATLEETKKDILERERKNAELLQKYNSIVSRSKALQYLVKNDIIVLPEIKVIRSLKTPGVDSLENLKKTSGVSDELIRKILVDLDQREIVSFDTYSGKFQIISEIDI